MELDIVTTMKSQLTVSVIADSIEEPTHIRNVKDYYEITGSDYSVWSKQLNMHFGYWAWGTNPFKRENLLQNLTKQVLISLDLQDDKNLQVGDFGCGYGATARYLASSKSNVHVQAMTIVPSQVEKSKLLNKAQGLSDRVTMHEVDYTNTKLFESSLNAAYAIESACHDAGTNKAALLKEMIRTLKPGARLVIADGFRTARPLPAFLQGAYRRFCDGWALPEMVHKEDIEKTLKDLSCDEINFTDISWRVAPSVAYIPWVALKHTICELWQGKGRLAPWRKKHIEASILTMVLGVALPWFRYGILVARKKSV